jgi:hypothetical protein
VSLGIFRPGAREIVLGNPGTGKTRHVEALTASAFRVLYFSPVPDYYREGRLWCTVDYLERWRGLLDDPHARIVVDVQDAEGAELAELLQRVYRLLREATRRKGGRPFVFVKDEVGDYKEWAEDTLLSIFRRSRHNRLASIMVSQCATDIPFRCRKMASRVACFGQEHPREIAELRAVYPAEFADRVERWNPGDPPAEWRSRTFAGRWEH